jgi:thioredoxin reductase (NADPH)
MKKIFVSFILALSTLTAEPREKVVILGGGIGSLTSALYMARAGLEPLVIEGKIPGGLLTQSHSVQNWPGELEIDGQTLMEKVRAQAEENGVRFSNEEVVDVDFSKEPFVLTLRSLENPEATRTIYAESCIIGMGTTPNFLNIPGEESYWGRGVTNCAICDGSLYKGKKVGVVGGGDAAVLEALYLSNIAKEVDIFVRKDSFRAYESSRVKALMERPNVKVHYDTTLTAVLGDGKEVKGVRLNSGEDFALDGLFLAIGSKPNTALFQKALKLGPDGYIALKKDQETFVPGVFAVGDIVDPVYKQAVSAAGDGAKAALQAQGYLMEKSNQIALAKSEKKKAPPKMESVCVEIHSVQQFKEELKNASSPVIVDFYATWCGPCKRLSPVFESSAHQMSGKVKFLKVNVDHVPDLSKSYNIRAMPTALLFNASGKEIQRKVGGDEISALLNDLDTGKL